MKPLITLLICNLLLMQYANSQDTLIAKYSTSQDTMMPQKLIAFRARVKTYDGQVKAGYLQAVTDSIISLSNARSVLRFDGAGEDAASNFKVASLDRVQLHRKGSVGRGIWGGALIGFATGFIGGIVQGNDPDRTVSIPDFIFGGGSYTYVVKGRTAVDKGLFLGLTGSLGGVIIGAIIGAISYKTFVIHGKRENYQKMRNKMMARLSR